MAWLALDLLRVGFGGALGIAVSARLTLSWTRRRELTACYVEYFSHVPAIARESDPATASSAFFLLSNASRRLESLESDPACICAADRLFTACKTLLSLFHEGGSGVAAAIVELRKQVSAEYENALAIVRRRHGIQADTPGAAMIDRREDVTARLES